MTEVEEAPAIGLGETDAVLMRRDPPFNLEYINDTYALERAEAAGCLIVNRPQALRDANEKYYTAWFAELCPATLFSRDQARLRDFVQRHRHAVIKPVSSSRSILRKLPVVSSMIPRASRRADFFCPSSRVLPSTSICTRTATKEMRMMRD